jgi:hypothetical protein
MHLDQEIPLNNQGFSIRIKNVTLKDKKSHYCTYNGELYDMALTKHPKDKNTCLSNSEHVIEEEEKGNVLKPY